MGTSNIPISYVPTAGLGKVSIGDSFYLYCGYDGWKEQIVTCEQRIETPDCGVISKPTSFTEIKYTLETVKLLVLFPKISGNYTMCRDYCSTFNGQLPTILNEEENDRLHWLTNYHKTNTWLDLKCSDVTIDGSVTHFWVVQEVGNVIEVECKRKHVLIGEATLTCQVVAASQLQLEWSSDPPTCKKLSKYVIIVGM
eukprot:sb/3470841/